MSGKPMPDPKGYAAARGDVAPDGYHYVWRVDSSWQTRRRNDRIMQCRWTDHGERCLRIAKAAFNRGSLQKPVWWWYCNKHLYGQLLWDGVVYSLALVDNTASQDAFDADHARLCRALEDGGWVVRLGDGSLAVDPEAPEFLVRPYRKLMEFGYANGLLYPARSDRSAGA